jgi:hypothetical protein
MENDPASSPASPDEARDGAALDPGRALEHLLEHARVHALLVGHRGVLRFRLHGVVVPVRVLGAGQGGQDHPSPQTPREPRQHARAPTRPPRLQGVARRTQLVLPERGVLAFDRAQTSIDVGDRRPALARGHRVVQERPVDLVLPVLEPTVDVAAALAHGHEDSAACERTS